MVENTSRKQKLRDKRIKERSDSLDATIGFFFEYQDEKVQWMDKQVNSMQNEVNEDQTDGKAKKPLKAPSIVEDIEKKLLMQTRAHLEKQYDKELAHAAIELGQKKRPPFPSIPSFIAAAIVLGFADFSDSVKCLM